MSDRDRWRQLLDELVAEMARAIRDSFFDGVVISQTLAWCDDWSSVKTLKSRVAIATVTVWPRIEVIARDAFVDFARDLSSHLTETTVSPAVLEDIRATCRRMPEQTGNAIFTALGVVATASVLITRPVRAALHAVLSAIPGRLLGGERAATLADRAAEGPIYRVSRPTYYLKSRVRREISTRQKSLGDDFESTLRRELRLMATPLYGVLDGNA